MSLIYTIDDIDSSLLHFKKDILNSNHDTSFFEERVKKIVYHTELNVLFSNHFKILNESNNNSMGNTHIPDKIAIKSDNKVLLIDYKQVKKKLNTKNN